MWIQNLTNKLNNHPEYRDTPVSYDAVARAISRDSFSKDIAYRIATVFGVSVELLLYPGVYGSPVPLLRRLCGGRDR